jgi:hypothetical protein
MIRYLLPTLCVMFCPFVSKASVYYLNTGQTGAQPSIDMADTTDWYSPSLGAPSTGGITFVSTLVSDFDPAFLWQFGGGDFDMKAGTSAAAGITLSLWDGGLSGSEVAWVTWTKTQFCTFKSSGCQQFDPADPLPFYFTDDHTATGNLTPYSMQVGHSYLVELTSDADTQGSAQYFIKAPAQFSIQDSSGGTLAGATPEPASWILVASAAVIALYSRRKQHRAV